MKARKPNTDQEAEVRFIVNGNECQEYVRSSHEPSDQNIVECFVPVTVGDEVTLRGHFTGSVKKAAYDLLIDGSFVATSRNGENSTAVKHITSTGPSFKLALSCPRPDDWTSEQSPNECIEGHMRVKELQSSIKDNFSAFEIAEIGNKTPGVGSIAVIISETQTAVQTYKHDYLANEIGSWRKRKKPINIRESGIPPDHEISLAAFNHEEFIAQKRSRKFRNHFEQERFGSRPWAKFIFYYRSQRTIDEEGCVHRSETVQELDPASQNKFELGETSPGIFADRDVHKASAAGNSDSAMFVSRSPPRRRNVSSEDQPGCKKKFGGLLALSKDEKKKHGHLGGTLKLDKVTIDNSLIFAEHEANRVDRAAQKYSTNAMKSLHVKAESQGATMSGEEHAQQDSQAAVELGMRGGDGQTQINQSPIDETNSGTWLPVHDDFEINAMGATVDDFTPQWGFESLTEQNNSPHDQADVVDGKRTISAHDKVERNSVQSQVNVEKGTHVPTSFNLQNVSMNARSAMSDSVASKDESSGCCHPQERLIFTQAQDLALTDLKERSIPPSKLITDIKKEEQEIKPSVPEVPTAANSFSTLSVCPGSASPNALKRMASSTSSGETAAKRTCLDLAQRQANSARRLAEVKARREAMAREVEEREQKREERKRKREEKRLKRQEEERRHRELMEMEIRANEDETQAIEDEMKEMQAILAMANHEDSILDGDEEDGEDDDEDDEYAV